MMMLTRQNQHKLESQTSDDVNETESTEVKDPRKAAIAAAVAREKS